MTESQRPTIVIPGDEPVQIAGSPQLQRLEARGEVVLHQDRPPTLEAQIERAKDATAILNSRGHVKWRREALDQLPKLRFITVCGIGTDSIDLDAACERGIVVSNIPGKTAPVVAEHAFALMMALAKRTAFQTAELRAGRWTRMENVLIAGKTLGIVGAGMIGGHMARLGRAIGMEVIAWTYHPSDERAENLGVRFVELDELLAASDVVSLHVKLTSDSQGLIGARELGLMKAGSLLVNTARGPVLDEDALVAALRSGHLAGAGLDVFSSEPLPADHPLLSCEQVVLTPHAADQTPEGNELLNVGTVDNILAFLDGNPQNVVT